MDGLLFTLTGALALFYVGLSLNVVRLRLRLKQSLGDGAHSSLTRAIRAHANFAEYVPLVLLLIWLAAAHGEALVSANTLVGVLLAGRISHAYSILIDEPTRNRKLPYFRMFGTIVTLTILILAALQLMALGFSG